MNVCVFKKYSADMIEADCQAGVKRHGVQFLEKK